MALFKIYKGKKFPNTGQITKATEGFAYFTSDDGKFYIDIEGDGTTNAEIGVNRIPLNAYKADQLSTDVNITVGNTIQAFNGASDIAFPHPLKKFRVSETAIGWYKIFTYTFTAAGTLNITAYLYDSYSTYGGIFRLYFNRSSSNTYSATLRWLSRGGFAVESLGYIITDSTINIYAKKTASSSAGYLDVVVLNETNRVGTQYTTLDSNWLNENVIAEEPAGLIYAIGNYASLLTAYTLDDITINNTAGNFAFKGSSPEGGTFSSCDWAGIQIDSGNDKFQITTGNSGAAIAQGATLLMRSNDSGGSNSTNWTDWKRILHHQNVTWADWGVGTTEGPTAKLKLAGITIESAAIPSASTTASGIITTGNQEFQGLKTFGYLGLTNKNASGTVTQYMDIQFRHNTSNSILGEIYYNLGSTTNVTKSQIIFKEGSPNTTADTDITGKYEYYQLPAATPGLTDNNTYQILTTKNTITIAQGGTGATTAYEAITNLGNFYFAGVGSNNNLVANDDLDDKRTVGTFISANSTISEDIINTPTTGSGYKLLIGRTYQANRSFQFAMAANSGLYYRDTSANSSTSTWNSWHQIAFTDSNITGNAATATAFSSNRTITLTGAITGSGSSNGTSGWSIETTIPNNSITNNKLEKSTIGIAGTNVALGSSISKTTLLSNLGLTNAAHYIGKATKDLTDGGTENPTISGYDFANDRKSGDIVLGKDGDKEYIWGLNGWELLGPVDTIQTSTATGTQNRIAYYSASNMISASSHYTDNTHISVADSTLHNDYTLYVNGVVGIKGNIIPIANNSYNLGTTDTLRWKSGFFTTSLRVGAINTTASDTDKTKNVYIGPDGFYTNGYGSADTGFFVRGEGTLYARLFINTIGSTATPGIATLQLGNSIDSSEAKNSNGTLQLYSNTTKYTAIKSSLEINGNHLNYLPVYSATGTSTYYGRLVGIYKGAGSSNVGSTGFSDVGSTSQPVYVTANGVVKAITGALGNDITGNANTATALTSSAGGLRNPIYFNNGKPAAGAITFNTLTANRLMWTSATDTPYAGYHYADSTHISIADSTLHDDYVLYINGVTGSKGNIIPITNNTYNLGSEALRWKQIYGNLYGARAYSNETKQNWEKVATWSGSCADKNDDTSVTFSISDGYPNPSNTPKHNGLLYVNFRGSNNSTTAGRVHCKWIVGSNITPENWVLTYVITSTYQITLNLYVNCTSSWQSWNIVKLNEHSWGTTVNEWQLLNATSGITDIPEGETQVVSTLSTISNNAATATKLNHDLTIALNNNNIIFNGSADKSITLYAPSTGGTADVQALVGNGTTSMPKWVNIDTTLTHTAGTASAASKLKVTVLGRPSSEIELTKATTAIYGVTKLTSSVPLNSTDETLAVTPKGVVYAINLLDVAAVGVAAATGNRYISQISETDGKISATLATATIGSLTKAIWVDGGTIKQVSYELKANVNDGTQHYLTMYTANTTIGPASDREATVLLSSAIADTLKLTSSANANFLVYTSSKGTWKAGLGTNADEYWIYSNTLSNWRLALNNSNMHLRSSSYQQQVTPSADATGAGIYLRDTENNYLWALRGYKSTANTMGVQLYTYGTDNKTSTFGIYRTSTPDTYIRWTSGKVDNNIYPWTSATWDIGSNDLTWNKLYSSAIIKPQDTVISSSTTIRSHYILAPLGGSYATTASTTTGLLKIEFPVRWTGHMINFKVDIYDYSLNNLVTYHIGGYNYKSQTKWVNTSAYSVGVGDKSNLTVRFCDDGTHVCVTIGETDTAWSYIQINVRDVYIGYTSTGVDDWNNAWKIGFVTTQPTISNNQVKTNTALVQDGTANRLAYYLTALSVKKTDSIYADNSHITINGTSAPANSGNFQVIGTSTMRTIYPQTSDSYILGSSDLDFRWQHYYGTRSIDLKYAGETGLEVDNTDKAHKVAFIVGTSGNAGIYDRTHKYYLIKSDQTNGDTTISANTAQNILFVRGNSSAVENARFNSAGHFIPGANATYDLGTTDTLRWRSGFFTTSLRVGAKNTDTGTDATTRSVYIGPDGFYANSVNTTTATLSNFVLRGKGVNYAYLHISTLGEENTPGIAILTLGNATASTNANNANGTLQLYANTTKYTSIKSSLEINGNHLNYLPVYNATGASTYYGRLVGIYKGTTSGSTGFSDKGSDNQPVYVTANGVVTPVAGPIATAYGGTGNNTFTKNRIIWSSTDTQLASTTNIWTNGTTIRFLKDGSTSYALLQNTYNSTVYDTLLDYQNGNIVLNGASLGLYLGYRNTTYIDFLGALGRWTSTGLGIGTTSPSYKLHVVGTGYFTDTVHINKNVGSGTVDSNTAPLLIGPLTGQNLAIGRNAIQARNDGATSKLWFNYEGGATSFGSSTSKTAPTTFFGTVTPGANATYDLGTTDTLRWRSGFFTTSLRVGAENTDTGANATTRSVYIGPEGFYANSITTATGQRNAFRLRGLGQDYAILQISTMGVANTPGVAEFILGNTLASTQDKNAHGTLSLYSNGTKGTSLRSADNSTSWYTATLQAKTGTIALISDIEALDVAAVGVAAATGNRYICQISQTNGKISATLATATIGSATRPIWIDAGTIKQGSFLLSATVNAGTANQVAYYSAGTTISSRAPAWEAWTAGTTAGPKANINIANATITSAAIPAASASASGIVTTGNQTFAGRKTINLINPHIYDGTGNSSRYRYIYFNNNSGDTYVGYIRYDSGNATNVTGGRYMFLQRSYSSTASPNPSEFYETYQLPAVTANLAESKAYSILTTKNVVTVAQGGTNKSQFESTGTAIEYRGITFVTAQPSAASMTPGVIYFVYDTV